MPGRIIETAADVAEGAGWLAARDPALAAALALTGQPPLRRRPDGFAALLDAIVGQQVSTAAAAAIWARLEAAGLVTEAAIEAASDEALRAAGLSRPKVGHVRALAARRLDYDGLRARPDHEVIDVLIATPGIGRWTADIYLVIALGRADVFPAGDLALREAARHLLGLAERPDEAALAAHALAWRPWRAVAARALWAYYRHIREREGIR